MINQEILDLIIAAIILSAIWAQLGTIMSHKVRIVSIQSVLLSLYIIIIGIEAQSPRHLWFHNPAV